MKLFFDSNMYESSSRRIFFKKGQIVSFKHVPFGQKPPHSFLTGFYLVRVDDQGESIFCPRK